MESALEPAVEWWLEQRLELLVHRQDEGLWLAVHSALTSVRLPGARAVSPRLVVVLGAAAPLERALELGQQRFAGQPFQAVWLLARLDFEPGQAESFLVLPLREWLGDLQEALLSEDAGAEPASKRIELVRFLLREAGYRSALVPVRRHTWHVVPRGDGWALKPEGENTAELFATKDDAIRAGAERARAVELGQLIVHRQDGRFEEERTYGLDPRDQPGLQASSSPGDPHAERAERRVDRTELSGEGYSRR